MTDTGSRIIVGLSGGVDSAVSAYLLVRQGYRVEGLFMKNWEDDDAPGVCPAAEDRSFADQVCSELGIPLHDANFSQRYREQVFEHCLAEFRAGRTPNPDVLCNRHIKFGALVDHAQRLGADAVATGHYAGIRGEPGNWRLMRAADPSKDQTYFLHALTQEQLAWARFPLAELTKARVREIAADAGFDNFNRKDSTGICFIGERDFRGFLAHYIEPQPGPIMTDAGDYLGEHMGLAFYTIGQRRGLDLGGRGGPWYVANKDPERNRLIVVEGHDHPALFSHGLQATPVHWIGLTVRELPRRCVARNRYRQPDQSCLIEPTRDGVRVCFDRPQRALTPGQYVVFYDREECLGGGVIDHIEGQNDEGIERVSA